MNNKNNYLISSVLMLVAALCFAVVAYGHFYNGNNPLGILSLISTILNVLACIFNYRNYKKSK